MPLASCVRCKKIFNKLNSSVCPACQPDEEQDFQKVREALEKSPELSIDDAAEAAGVGVAVITRMLKEGVLENLAMSEAVTCGRCGAPAISASKRLCQNCLDRLNLDVAEAQQTLQTELREKTKSASTGMNVRRVLDEKRK